MLFTKQKSIASLLGLLNKILCILVNQEATKLQEVKFDQDFPKIYYVYNSIFVAHGAEIWAAIKVESQ